MKKLDRLIYVVEDDDSQAELLKACFEQVEKYYPVNFEIIVFKDARSVIGSILERKPDLMTLDLGLELSNGTEVLQCVHKDLGLSFPIIVVSGSVDMSSIQDLCPIGKNCGLGGLLTMCSSTVYKLTKPYDFKFFEILVRKIIL